jgi:hypothetical protein
MRGHELLMIPGPVDFEPEVLQALDGLELPMRLNCQCGHCTAEQDARFATG